MQEGAIAVTNAVYWLVVWDQIASPCLSKGIYAGGEPLHVNMTRVCPISGARLIDVIASRFKFCTGANVSRMQWGMDVQAQKAEQWVCARRMA